MGFVDGRLSDGVGPDRLVQGKFRSPVSSLRSIVYEGGQIFTANKNDGIISFFPLTFRSFLSSSFSFLFYNNTRLGINSRGRIARCLASFSQTESSQTRLKAQFLALFVLLFPPPSLPRYSIWFSVTTVATAVDLSRVHDPCVARRCS